jgi:hypothetical protein
MKIEERFKIHQAKLYLNTYKIVLKILIILFYI